MPFFYSEICRCGFTSHRARRFSGGFPKRHKKRGRHLCLPQLHLRQTVHPLALKIIITTSVLQPVRHRIHQHVHRFLHVIHRLDGTFTPITFQVTNHIH